MQKQLSITLMKGAKTENHIQDFDLLFDPSVPNEPHVTGTVAAVNAWAGIG